MDKENLTSTYICMPMENMKFWDKTKSYDMKKKYDQEDIMKSENFFTYMIFMALYSIII